MLMKYLFSVKKLNLNLSCSNKHFKLLILHIGSHFLIFRIFRNLNFDKTGYFSEKTIFFQLILIILI